MAQSGDILLLLISKQNKFEGILSGALDLVLIQQGRATGAGAYTAVGKINTHIDKVVFKQVKIMECITQLCSGIRIYRT